MQTIIGYNTVDMDLQIHFYKLILLHFVLLV